MSFKQIKGTLLLVASLVLSGPAFGQDNDPHARGWRPPTPEEQAWVDAHMVKTRNVKLNGLALSRINAERQQHGLRPLAAADAGVVPDGQEALGTTATEPAVLQAAAVLASAAASTTAPTDLPRQVDNSLLKYFPPIRSQGSFDSCTSFSTTYYTLTFMVGRANDWDVRSDASHQMSPKFTFNLGNLGGANSTDGTAVSIMQAHGCATWAELPYDSDAASFPTTAAIWRSATRYRTSAFGYLAKLDTDSGFLQLKAMLANGYLLNFATGAPTGYNEWSNTTLKNDPATTNDDAFTGQLVGYQVEGASHEMTVVGYNDDLWCDINGNGAVDPGEKGALKIANSWGSSWGNAGFIWLSYDALKKTSAVPGWVGPAGRINAFFNSQAIWISARTGGYAPSLLAECVLSHPARSQIVVSGGHGSASALAPDFTRGLSWFNMAGALAFSGTMVFDLSDFADAGPAYRWFVGFQDTASDAAAGSIQSVKLTDGQGNLLATCAATVPAGGYPLAFNGNTVWAYANLQFSDTTPPAAVTDLSATATPTQLQLWWTAPGDDGNNGVAKSYEIRYSASPITTANWAAATVCANPPVPGPAGTQQTYSISSLTPGSTWYAALKATDEVGNTSPLSNVAQVTLPMPLSITTASSLPAAYATQAYSIALSATGGVPPYTWKPAVGYIENPPSTGVLSGGTPQNFHADSSSGSALYLPFASGFKFPICGIPTTTASISPGGYIQFYEAISSVGTCMLFPFWSGLSTTAAGEDIFVTSAANQVTIRWRAHPTSRPTEVGTVNFQVTMYSDGRFQFMYGDCSTNTASIGLLCGVSDWSISSAFTGTVIPVGTASLFSLSQLPTGLNLNPMTGILSGTPSVAGTFGFSIAVTDNADVRVIQRATKKFSLTVNASSNQPPTIVSAPWANPNPVSLPASTAVHVVASDPDGGPAALSYTWSKVSGPGSVTFSPNSTAASDDSTASFSAAGAYVLRVTVTDGQAQVSGDVSVTVLASPVVVTLVATDASASEPGSNTGLFTVTRSGGSTAAALTVRYAVSGTASPGADFAALSGIVTIPAGATTATILLTPLDDSIGEPTETVVLTLTADPAYVLGSPASATASILDNEPVVTLSAYDAIAAEPGTDTGRFLVSRSGSTAAALTVNYARSGTATNGVDYASLSGSLTIPAGSTAVYLYVTPLDDSLVEGKETVIVTLAVGPGYLVGAASSGTVSIIDNEYTRVQVSASDASASEPGTDTGSYLITRTGSTAAALTVSYAMSGTAANGSDYATLPGSATIPAGASSVTVLLTPLNDSLVEGRETAILTLVETAAYQVYPYASGTVYLFDDEMPVVKVVATDATAAEPADPGTYTVTRTGSTATPLTVNYTSSGTATKGVDYVALSGSVTIPAGASSAAITVAPLDDGFVEGREYVYLVLAANPAYQVSLTSYAYVYIYDDEKPWITIAATDYTASETPGNPGAFTLTRLPVTASPLTVSYTLSGSAANGVDYTALSGSVTFSGGSASALIAVTSLDDAVVEATESVTATLAAGLDYQAGSPGSATVNMYDNEATVSVSAPDSSAAEPGTNTGLFQIWRSGGVTTMALTVTYSVGGTATPGTDYTALSGTATIPAGATSVLVAVTPRDDTAVEGSETVILTLSPSSTYRLGSAAATVNITDND